jgi:hypothetical protein
MTGILIAILVLGAVSSIPRLFARRRTITPSFSPDFLSGPRVATVEPDEPIEWESVTEDAVMPAEAARAMPLHYLLNDPRNGRPDRIAAIMDMMAGPGICTPRDR